MFGRDPLVELADRDGLGGLEESPRPFGEFLYVHVCVPVGRRLAGARPSIRQRKRRPLAFQCGSRHTATQGGGANAHRISVSLPGEGSDGRGAGGGGGGAGRLHPVGPRLRAGAGRRAGFDPDAAEMAAEDELHVPDEERPHRGAVLLLRTSQRHAGDPRARRYGGGGERADRGGARADRQLPDRLPGRGGARHAALPPRPRPQLLRPAAARWSA